MAIHIAIKTSTAASMVGLLTWVVMPVLIKIRKRWLQSVG
ncbi:hypothetical protein SAMN05421820_10615 [Pedobacter steynii]|uniref:Uncharacterized protein n=1 Tax=Pedobacter steynii TaxID=430522 RepID=A0A1G9Y7N1_9SPHI|nr:hypothetical protein SAMN05421820_10615 [Pedobacter steynii]